MADDGRNGFSSVLFLIDPDGATVAVGSVAARCIGSAANSLTSLAYKSTYLHSSRLAIN